MNLSLKGAVCQVTLYLVIQGLCVWILSEARVKPIRSSTEDRRTQRKVNRTHKPCTGSRNEVLSDDPCDRCRCVNGITRCHKRHCANNPLTCVDSVTSTGSCCPDPTCPNGPNCWHNGEKLNGRKLHRERDYNTGCIEMCSCPPAWKVDYNSETKAECNTHCPIRRRRRNKRQIEPEQETQNNDQS